MSLLLWSLQIKSVDRLLNKMVRGNHFLYSQSIMVIHANTNCCTHFLAAHERTPRSGAQAIKGRSMVS
jgi:hypothetical protein